MSEFIAINKIIEPVGGNPMQVKKETISVEDIRSFRKWDKNDDEETVIKGEFVLLKCISHGKNKGLWEVKIQESEEAFSKRISKYRHIIPLA